MDEDDDWPVSGDVYAMWRELAVVAVDFESAAADAYMAAFAEECGGRTARGCLQLGAHPLIDEYFDRLDRIKFGHMVLSGTAAEEAVPEVLAGSASPPEDWEQYSRFALAGLLAEHLHTGAGIPDGEAGRHMALATALVGELIEDRYDDMAIWTTDEVLWSDWFRRTGFTAMWLVADRANRLVHILCLAIDDPEDDPEDD